MDLGGDSAKAGLLVAKLRSTNIPAFQALSVRDVFLAERLDSLVPAGLRASSSRRGRTFSPVRSPAPMRPAGADMFRSVCAEVLGIDKSDVDLSLAFMDLGGDSAKAGLLVAKLRSTDNTAFQSISVRDIFLATALQDLLPLESQRTATPLSARQSPSAFKNRLLSNKASSSAQVSVAAEATDAEVAAVCAAMLGVGAHKVDLTKSFVSQGGDAATAAVLATRLRALQHPALQQVTAEDVLAVRALQELLAGGEAAALPATPGELDEPTTPMGDQDDVISEREKSLSEAVREVLDVEYYDPHKGFLEITQDEGKASALVDRLIEKSTSFAGLTVVDLYEQPTFQHIAELHFDDETDGSASPLMHASSCPNIAGRMRGDDQKPQSQQDVQECPYTLGFPEGKAYPKLCAALQLAMGLFIYLLEGVYTYITYIVIFRYATRWLTGPLAFLPAPAMLAIFFPLVLMSLVYAYLVYSFATLLLFKWALIGRYKPGYYRIHSWFYMRHWMVERLNRRVHWRFMYMSPYTTFFWRLMGCHVAGNSAYVLLPDHTPMTGWDLVTLGRRVSINYAYVSPIYYVHNTMVCARVVLHDDSCVLPRATVLGPVELGRGSVLDCLSCLPVDGSALGAEENVWYRGSPAQRLPSPSLAQRHGMDDGVPLAGRRLTPTMFSILDNAYHFIEGYGAAFIIVGPQVFLLFVEPFATQIGLWPSIAMHSAAAFVCVIFVYTLYKGLQCRAAVALLPSQPGTYHLYSLEALAAIYKMRWFQFPQPFLNNTLLQNSWMRLCGMRLGEHSEVSQIKGVPDMIAIGNDCFLANFTHIAVPHVRKDTMVIGRAVIEDKVLLGNQCCIPINAHVAEDNIIGVFSVPPIVEPEARVQKARPATWVGNPPFRLPKGEATPYPDLSVWWHIFRRVDDILLILTPFALFGTLIVTQLAWIYFISPGRAVLVFGWVTLDESNAITDTNPHLPYVWIVNAVGLGGAVLLIGCLAGLLARITFGNRNKEASFQYNSMFIFRWRHYNKTWAMFIKPTLLLPFEASVWMNWIFRIFTRAKIGDNALILADTVFRDHNFVTIENNAVINDEVVFRTHTFEDWLLKMSRITVQEGAVLWPSTTTMPGTVLERGAQVGPNSMCMKNERLSANGFYIGLPTAHLGVRPQPWKEPQVEVVSTRFELPASASFDSVRNAAVRPRAPPEEAVQPRRGSM
mmetsp:Transcript_13100/g.33431  ORF Transcript_13100/g.33431 Transcript_13100/m.33431 type:complete len:1200 (-) Transcript_13100:200-3799(-)